MLFFLFLFSRLSVFQSKRQRGQVLGYMRRGSLRNCQILFSFVIGGLGLCCKNVAASHRFIDARQLSHFQPFLPIFIKAHQSSFPIFGPSFFEFELAGWQRHFPIVRDFWLVCLMNPILSALKTLLVVFSMVVVSFFFRCSLARMSRYRSILPLSRGVFLNMVRKYAHSELMRGSVTTSLITMVQNWLKQSATSVITIIINLCLQTKLISSIKHPPMKNKPLINQANLQKISKTQPFLIRGKPNITKNNRHEKTLKTMEPDPFNTQIDECCQILDSYLVEIKPLAFEHADRLHKLLLLFKNRSTLMQSSVMQDSCEEGSPLLIRKSESKYFNKIKNDIQEEKTELWGMHEKQIFEASKLKSTKLKLGKENNAKSAVFLELKLEKLQSKLLEQEKSQEEQKETISHLKGELEETKKKYQLAEAENLQISLHQIELKSQLTIALQNKKEAEIQLVSKTEEFQAKIESLSANIKTLNQLLRDREAEIIALFTQHL